MDAETLISLQVNALSPDDSVRIPAEEQIQAFKDENPLDYVLTLVEISISTDESKYIYIAITNLYSVCTHSDFLMQDEFLEPFFERFGQAVQTLFVAPYVNETTRNLAGNILAEVTNTLHQRDPANMQIQNFLLQSIQTDTKYAPAVIHTISEILEASDDICNFTVDDLVALLNIQTQTLPRVKLYFALAPHVPEEDTRIHELFEPIFQQIDSDPSNLSNVFRVIAHFCEKHSKFLAPHIPAFIPFIATSVLNSDDDNTKREGIYIFLNMSDNEPEMCCSSEIFYQNVIDLLIRVMSTADETNWYDPDDNDADPCIIARQVFEPITKNIASEKAFQYLTNIKTTIIDEQQQPELIYGALMALAEAAPLLMSNAIPVSKHTPVEEIDVTDTYFYSTLEIIINDGAQPPIRYAAYCAATNFAKNLGPVFQDITHEQYLETIVCNISQEIPPVAKACLKFLKTYLKRWKIDGIVPIYSQLELAFLGTLQDCEDADIIVLVLNILGVLVEKMLLASVVPVNISYSDIITILNTLMDVEGEYAITIQVNTIMCFSQIISEHIRSVCDTEEITELISTYFSAALEIDSSNECPPLLIPKLGKAIQKLMRYLGPNFNQYAGDIVQEAVETLQTLPQAQEYTILDPVITSALYYVPNSKPGTRSYIENNDITAIKTALNTLSAAAYNLVLDFAPFLESTLPLIYQLIEQPEFINPIQEEAFRCLTSIIQSQVTNPDNFFVLIPAFIDHFKAQATKPWKPSSLSVFLKSASELAKSAYKLLKTQPAAIDQVASMFTQLFDSIVYLKGDLDSKKDQKHSEQVQFDLIEPSTIDVSQIADAQSSLCYLFKRIGKIAPPQAIQCFREHLLQKILEDVSNPILSTNSLEFLMRYINLTRDESVLNEHIDVILGILNDTEKFTFESAEEDEENDMKLFETDSDNFNTILEGLIEFCWKNPISPDLGTQLLQTLKILFDANFLMRNIFNVTDDCVKIAICAITLKNPTLISDADRLELINGCLNICESNKYNTIIPLTLLKSFENEYDYWDEDDSPIVEQPLYEAITSFFSFFKPDSVKKKHAQQLIGFFYRLAHIQPRFHQRVNEYIQYLQSIFQSETAPPEQKAFVTNALQYYKYFNNLCLEMRDIQQRKMQQAAAAEESGE